MHAYEPCPQMRIGLALPSHGKGTCPESLDAAASAAQRLGWDSVWATDHLLVPAGPEAAQYGHILEAVTALTYVGARYERLRIGSSVVIPAMRDAPLLAKQLATLDLLTHGRLTVGVGVSDRGDLGEYTNLGKQDRFDHRGPYLDEAIALWRHLWGGSTEPFHGKFHHLDDFTFLPLPPQGADLPIWCGGRSDRALRRAAQLADGYHAARTGPADVANRLPRLAQLAEHAGKPLPTISVRARVRFDKPEASVFTIHGSAAEMVETLLAFARLGTEELILVFDATEPEDVVRLTQRFDSDVVQPFRERAAAGDVAEKP